MNQLINTVKMITQINYNGPHQIQNTSKESYNTTDFIQDDVFWRMFDLLEGQCNLTCDNNSPSSPL